MTKYRLVKDKKNGERAIVIYKTGEVVTESGQRERYTELRKKAIANMIKREKNSILREMCGTSARQARIDMGL